MSRTRLVASVAALVMTGAVLAGCSGDDTESAPSTSPTATFASDEEVLLAAEVTVRGYYKTVGAILADGGEDGTRLRPFVSEEIYDAAEVGFKRMRDEGWHQVGEIAVESPTLATSTSDLGFGTHLAYVCVDYSHRVILDSDGYSIEFDGFSDRQLIAAKLSPSDSDPMKLVVAGFEEPEDARC